MLALLVKLVTWMDTWAKVDWHSWILHGLAAIPITYLFGYEANSTFFLLREGEQLAFEVRDNAKPKWKDHFFDWFVPSVVGGFVEALRKSV